MALFEDYIGSGSEPVENPVERVAVRRFAEAIGQPHPLYTDPDYARASRYGGLIAPPTFPRTFDYGAFVGSELPPEGLLHGSHRISYERPLYVGEDVLCRMRLVNSFDRDGRAGRLGFLVFERTGHTPDGERIFTCEDAVIATEKLRESLAL